MWAQHRERAKLRDPSGGVRVRDAELFDVVARGRMRDHFGFEPHRKLGSEAPWIRIGAAIGIVTRKRAKPKLLKPSTSHDRQKIDGRFGAKPKACLVGKPDFADAVLPQHRRQCVDESWS